MFTGIVQGAFQISDLLHRQEMLTFSVVLPQQLLSGLNIGASIAVEGVCLTVTQIREDKVFFDAIEETLKKTSLGSLTNGSFVNIERSAKYGDEIGGHLLSGHIIGKALLADIQSGGHTTTLRIDTPKEWMKYILEKGFIAINGCSLTVCDADPRGFFYVHLIPETLRITTFSKKKTGDYLNIEIDSHTRAVVDTVERYLNQKD